MILGDPEYHPGLLVKSGNIQRPGTTIVLAKFWVTMGALSPQKQLMAIFLSP